MELDAKVPRQVGLSGGSITLGLSPYFRCKSKEKAKHPRSELVCAVGERLNVCLKTKKGRARIGRNTGKVFFNSGWLSKPGGTRSYLQADFARFKLLPAWSPDSFGTMETTM